MDPNFASVFDKYPSWVCDSGYQTMPVPINKDMSLKKLKVYRLNDVGQWDDQGTGHLHVGFLEQFEELGIHVTSVNDGATLLVHRISAENTYTLQADYFISWKDKERSEELALSFQETTECSHLWNHINRMQRILQLNSLNSKTFRSVRNELKELPNVDLSTLPQILKIITERGNRDRRRLIELILKDDAFFPKLMDVFETSETVNNVHDLHMIFNIVKGIILLNSPQILQIILGDQMIMKIIGCLEYDPDVTQSKKHRNHLRTHAVFNEAIPIKDPLYLSKIQRSYLAGYLKDVVLAPFEHLSSIQAWKRNMR